MTNSIKNNSRNCDGKYFAIRRLGLRTAFLFINFLLIIMALYHLKPASRSLFIESLGADRLPHVWIGTGLTMMLFIPFYNRMVVRISRFRVVLGTCLAISGLLVIFRLLLITPTQAVSAGFYIFVDILGVVLVEQFWSLTNSIYSTDEGQRWYGMVGTGGLVGGVLGGVVSAFIIRQTALQTPDLLLVAGGIILTIFALTWVMDRFGLYCEVDRPEPDPRPAKNGWRVLGKSRYLFLIAAILLLAQLASPLIDYQFLKTVEEAYPEREARTAFLSMFFSLMGTVSIGVNLGLTPLFHRKLGAIAGLLVQPLMMSLCAFGFLVHPVLFWGGASKISDRGLSYSINRASKELLYIPVDPVLIYQAKAWIDMFGYRMFKVFGSFVILIFTQWLPFAISVQGLSSFTIGICALWIGLIAVIRTDYRLARKEEFA
ncbi:hypothetical protein DENIS_1382 [Desulfonema ishimotonii]|uniref:ADP,ATP carrier protein n=1 Tax=Desulfonema ishimotonii TaxID=45657 RepID=A0A401FTZ5_9BACT|nr:Npt1/Npt2 family nucleotide transporter [Desulfonema ishimotonii]GBC60430.1 hypothetical protein DENIS_1382 [Desulfonema ishimotonii]